MRVLFLDIDGVLNSVALMLRGGWKAGTNSLDAEALQRLERIMTESGCVVVITSVWRKRLPLTKIHRIFVENGFSSEMTLRIIGTTGDLGKSRCRGQEVDAWLKAQGPLSFVILDDDSDFEPHLDRLVLVDNRTGLTDQDVERVLERFM